MPKARVGQLLRLLAAIALAAFWAAPASAFLINVYNVGVQEYVNDFTGHYFLAADAEDANALASGAAGPGWHTTTNEFGAYTTFAPYGMPMYRFYAPGPNSHFYTADPVELAIVRAPGSGWIEEGVKFRIDVPVNNACPSSEKPVHRLYNNRFIYNDSAHRYVFDDAVRNDMVANKGWTDEGVVFCATSISKVPSLSILIVPEDIRTAADCQNEAIHLGACIGMNALPTSFPNDIVSWAPPLYVTRGPLWNDAYGNVTGTHDYDVFTAQPPGDSAAVLAHTYLQGLFSTSGTYILGMHVSSADASTSLASVDPVYQFTTSEPAPGQADQRIFPWTHPNENYIDVSFNITPQTVKRYDAQSHGYGNALLEFRDLRSGHAIDVTVLAYGTVPPGDFVGVQDPSTGNVWVSTTVGESMLFGTNLGSDFVPCSGQGPCTPDFRHAFHFQVSAADFTNIVARARVYDPALSTDNSNYILVRYLVRNGILGHAELGVTMYGAGLSVFGY